MDALRVAIIGSGGMARAHANALDNTVEGRVVAVASRNVETGQSLADDVGATFYPDWRDVMRRDDIDGVVICTHNDSHGEIAIAALTRRKHVLTEYPLARSIQDGETALSLADSQGLVLRITHSEVTSAGHAALRDAVAGSGDLMLYAFNRLTPGRGGRPEVLLNLPVSGPPAHFFIYHIYAAVDLFGPAEWVEASAHYEGLGDDGLYDSFINTMTVRFARGGLGVWSWAGGVETEDADQQERIVLTGATITREGTHWRRSTREATEDIPPSDVAMPSKHELWIREALSGDNDRALADGRVALDAIRVSLSAERAMDEGGRVEL
jgi:biliverdin reductase